MSPFTGTTGSSDPLKPKSILFSKFTSLMRGGLLLKNLISDLPAPNGPLTQTDDNYNDN